MGDILEGLEGLKKISEETTPLYEDVMEKVVSIAGQIAMRIGRGGASYMFLPRGYGVVHQDMMSRQGNYMLIKWPEKEGGMPKIYASELPTADELIDFVEDLKTGLLKEFMDYMRNLGEHLSFTHSQLVWNLPPDPSQIKNLEKLQKLLEEPVRTTQQADKPVNVPNNFDLYGRRIKKRP